MKFRNYLVQNINDRSPLSRSNPELYAHVREKWWGLVLAVKALVGGQLNQTLEVSGNPDNFQLYTIDTSTGYRLIVHVGDLHPQWQVTLQINIPLEDQVHWSKSRATKGTASRLREHILREGVAHLMAKGAKHREWAYGFISKLYPTQS
jgi:hypothetical protein